MSGPIQKAGGASQVSQVENGKSPVRLGEVNLGFLDRDLAVDQIPAVEAPAAPRAGFANGADAMTAYYEARNVEQLREVYGRDVVFQDPVFGRHEGWRALARRLFEMTNPTVQITTEKTGSDSVKWVAKYEFGASNRPVENHGTARATLDQHGKIATHTDDFDTKKWAKQALGFPGTVLGLLPKSLRNMVLHQVASKAVDDFVARHQLGPNLWELPQSQIDAIIAKERSRKA